MAPAERKEYPEINYLTHTPDVSLVVTMQCYILLDGFSHKYTTYKPLPLPSVLTYLSRWDLNGL